MSKSELLPEPKDEIVSTSLSLDQTSIDWLDEIGKATSRSRSDVAREIFRNVRNNQPVGTMERRATDRRKAS